VEITGSNPVRIVKSTTMLPLRTALWSCFCESE
jgi:hypothetical protein